MLYQRQDVVAAMIADDGIGFDVEAARRSGRLGLMGMRERAELWGGKLSIDSQPGRGARIVVEVPRVPTSPVFVKEIG